MRLIEEILADINKAKAKVTSVELEIGRTTGVTSQINRLIQAQNLLTYCHSRLSDIDPESLRPKWISVEDRLPEIGQEVIVYRNDCVYSMRFWDKKHPLWESTSHWMPLPEPPRADMRGDA